MAHNGVPNLDQYKEKLDACREDECGVVIAESLASMGLRRFTTESVLLAKRELSVERKYVELIGKFMISRSFKGGNMKSKTYGNGSRVPKNEPSPFAGGSMVLWVSGREQFYVHENKQYLSPADCDPARGSWYGGKIKRELTVEGEHVMTLLRSFSGREPSFNEALPAFLGGAE